MRSSHLNNNIVGGGTDSAASRRNDTAINDDSNNSNINVSSNYDRDEDTKNDEDTDTVLRLSSLSLVEYLVTEGMTLAGLTTSSDGSDIINSEKPPANLLLGVTRSRAKTDEEIIEDIRLLVERLSSKANNYSSGRSKQQHGSGCGEEESDNTNKVMMMDNANTVKKDRLLIEKRVAEIIHAPHRSVPRCVQPLVKAEKGHASGAVGSTSPPSSFSSSPSSSIDIEGWTPLHAACRYHSISVIEHLLKLGADPRATDDAGWLPLELFLFARDHNLLDGPETYDEITSSDITRLITLFVKVYKFSLALMQQRETEGCRADGYADSPRVRFHLYKMGLPASQIGLIRFIERGLCRRLCGCDRPKLPTDSASHTVPTDLSKNNNNNSGRSLDTSFSPAAAPSPQTIPRVPYLYVMNLEKACQALMEGNLDHWGRPAPRDEVKPREIKKVFEIALAGWASRGKKKLVSNDQDGKRAAAAAAVTIDLLFHRVCEYCPDVASTILDSPAASFVDTNYVPMDSDFSSLSLLLGARMREFFFRPSFPAVRKIIRQFAELGFNFSIMWRSPTAVSRPGDANAAQDRTSLQTSTRPTAKDANETEEMTELTKGNAITASTTNARNSETDKGGINAMIRCCCERNEACVSYLSWLEGHHEELDGDNDDDGNNNNSNSNYTGDRPSDESSARPCSRSGGVIGCRRRRGRRWCVSPSLIDPFLLDCAAQDFEVEVLLDLVRWSMLGVRDTDRKGVVEAETRRLHVVYGDSDDEEEEEDEDEDEMRDPPTWMPERVTEDAERQSVDPEKSEADMMQILDRLAQGKGLAAAPSHMPALPFLMNRLHDDRLKELARAAHSAVQTYQKAVLRFYFAKSENHYYDGDYDSDDDDEDADEVKKEARIKKRENFGELSWARTNLPVFGFSPSVYVGAEEDPSDNAALRAIRNRVFRTAKEAEYRVDRCVQYQKLLSSVLDIFFASGVDFSSFRSLIYPALPHKKHVSNYYLLKVRLFVKFNDDSDETTATCPMTLARKSRGSLLINNGVYDHATYYGLEGTVPILIGLGETGTTLLFLDKILSQGLLSGSLTNNGDRSHVYAIEEALRYRLERGLFDSSERTDFFSNIGALYWYEKILGNLFDYGVITPDDLFWYLFDFAEFYYNSYRQHAALELDKVRGGGGGGDCGKKGEDDADISSPQQEHTHHDRDGREVTIPKLQSLPQYRSLYNYRYVLKHLLTLMGDTVEGERARKLYGGSKLALWENEDKFCLDYTLRTIDLRPVGRDENDEEQTDEVYEGDEDEEMEENLFKTESFFIGDIRFKNSK